MNSRQWSCLTCRNTCRQMNSRTCRSAQRQSLCSVVGVLRGSEVVVDEEVLGDNGVVVVEGGSRVVVLVGILVGR